MYLAFSWQWWLRRAWLFWPIALVYGAGYATWHAFGMNALGDWPILALVAGAGGLVMVSAGPLLATGVRYIRLPLRWERVLVIVALLIGLVVAKSMELWVNSYHQVLMAHLPGHSTAPPAPWLFSALSGALRFGLDGSTLVFVAVGGGLALVPYLNERRRLAAYEAQQQVSALRSERDAADLRMAVLQAQVEPHFLFNTLASVRSLVASDPKRAAMTIDALADYLRATLPSLRDTGEADATLGRQVTLCHRYLELMNIRMGGRILIVIDVSDAIRALPFPPLILISLVENAVKHGVEPKPGPCEIAIRATLHDARMRVVVEDDGAGLVPGPSQGMGLANVRAQLRNRFGANASLAIVGRAGGGTCAVIEMATQ
ncbi:sensor histidine kinase [Asticcacaulis sp.]|uniref:sensor histidine kinase n=1 Tax=Asticcacaulis sp. TaxID=1872648 RepID=UPI003F7C265F